VKQLNCFADMAVTAYVVAVADEDDRRDTNGRPSRVRDGRPLSSARKAR